LASAAAYATLHAGDKLSIPRKTFRGVTAAVAPNRKLAAGIVSVLFTCSLDLHASCASILTLQDVHLSKNTINRITKISPAQPILPGFSLN
jgi:hypothetical protein